MARYSESFLNQIKEKVDIVDLISSYISVKSKGRDYWACCPFHNEKTPSFQIRQDFQYYKCYGCGKSGNIFTFVMEYEKISFVEAIEFLANKAGLELPDQTNDIAYIKRKEDIDKIYEINKAVAIFYHKNLFSTKGEKGLEYFQSRQLDNKMISTFGMGYSSDFDSLPKYLEKKGYDIASMKMAGVIGINEKNNSPYDFFGGRIIIPIIDANGNIIGFTARLLEKKPEFAKYKNTSNTLAFDKRKNLFGINLLKKLRMQGTRKVILVEGHMDVVGLYQYDIKNVVASMGTSLTIEQCRQLKKYADIVYVSFDGDSAGQNATMRGLDILKKEGLEVRVVMLTNNLDPDDYVRINGKEGYQKLLDDSMPLIDFKLHNIKKNYTLNSYDDRSKYAIEAINVLSSLDSLEQSIYVKEVAKLSKISEDVLLGQVQSNEIDNQEAERLKREKISKQSLQDNTNIIVAERFVLSAILHLESCVDFAKIEDSLFSTENHKKVFDYIKKCIINQSQPKLNDIYEVLENDEECIFIIDAIEKYCDLENRNTFYDQSLNKLKEEQRKSKLVELQDLFKKATTKEEKDELKDKLKNYQNKKNN
ncbi:MAG: DNA primase [Clostridia bacterium]